MKTRPTRRETTRSDRMISPSTHRSLILETYSEIWKFSFQRVNELKTKPCLLGRLELWWQMGCQLPQKWENLIISKDSIS